MHCPQLYSHLEMSLVPDISIAIEFGNFHQ